MMLISEPGRIIAVILMEKLEDYNYIFYGIYVFSKLIFGSLIKTKETKEIVSEITTKYIQGGGMIPDKLWSDCGGKFNSTMIKDLCKTINVKIVTGPGFTPTSNTIAERYRMAVYRILKKMIEEKREMDPQDALGWAIHARNIYPGTYGWSPFQLIYGRNPKPPGIGGDKLPALSGTIMEALGGHLDNLLSAQRNYRESVNLNMIKTALVYKLRSTEREFKNGEKVYFKRENLKQGNRSKWEAHQSLLHKSSVLAAKSVSAEIDRCRRC